MMTRNLLVAMSFIMTASGSSVEPLVSKNESKLAVVEKKQAELAIVDKKPSTLTSPTGTSARIASAFTRYGPIAAAACGAAIMARVNPAWAKKYVEDCVGFSVTAALSPEYFTLLAGVKVASTANLMPAFHFRDIAKLFAAAKALEFIREKHLADLILDPSIAAMKYAGNAIYSTGKTVVGGVSKLTRALRRKSD